MVRFTMPAAVLALVFPKGLPSCSMIGFGKQSRVAPVSTRASSTVTRRTSSGVITLYLKIFKICEFDFCCTHVLSPQNC